MKPTEQLALGQFRTFSLVSLVPGLSQCSSSINEWNWAELFYLNNGLHTGAPLFFPRKDIIRDYECCSQAQTVPVLYSLPFQTSKIKGSNNNDTKFFQLVLYLYFYCVAVANASAIAITISLPLSMSLPLLSLCLMMYVVIALIIFVANTFLLLNHLFALLLLDPTGSLY